jgi:hypothetical protein
MTVNYIIQLKRSHSTEWTAKNPLLKSGEPGFESDTNKLKIGDGVTRWNLLDYVAPDEADGLISKFDIETVTTSMIADDAIDRFKIADETINDSHIATDAAIDVSKISGAVHAVNGTVTTASTSSSVVRNIMVSTSAPSGGNNGDVWLVYLP